MIQTTLIAGWWWSGRIAGPTPDTGSLAITSDPVGAAVSIDGTPRGTTPYSITLTAGVHQLEIGSGAQTRTQSITISRGGETSVHASLSPGPPAQSPAPAATTGGLQISTDPGGARVAVDGQPRGSAPITIAALAAGPHQITIAGAEDVVTRRVTVQPGITTSLIVSLTSSGAGSSGWLAITIGVPAQIFENGTLLGTTDTPRIMLPSGRHDLVISSEALGYSVSHSVQIGAGQTVSLQLETPRGTLNINALPWANVWVDGQSVGETPIDDLSLPIGTHEVVFRHPDFGEQRRTVAVGATGSARVAVDFRK